MSFSLDTPSVQTLKAEARALREARAQSGTPLTHGAALEQVARGHGYRDWNTARAAMPGSVITPLQVGGRVTGLYLDRPFTGTLLGMQLLGDGGHAKLTLQFDTPVNVTPDFMFATLRHRVTATVDGRGVTPALRGNGQPQLTVRRA